jgi:D-alanyl-lipoteichoic acid acyltransferase DltB (MBOAT superfamily)
MIFTELSFLAFFALVFGVYWCLTSHRARKLWLLAASYFFYGAWDWRFLSLIVGSTALDYVVGLRLEGNDDERSRKRWIALSVVANLGLLGVFKYANFFLDSAIRLANALGFEASPHVLGIVLPVGISFYTFQTMSYSLDVYRRELRASSRFFRSSSPGRSCARSTSCRSSSACACGATCACARVPRCSSLDT